MRTLRKTLMIVFAIFLIAPLSLNAQNPGSNLANIDGFITNQMNISKKPGLAALIIKGDSMVWSGNYGYANVAASLPVSDSTLFNAFSIGKSLTAACVMQLWEEGLLGLDQDINDFLPFQIDNPHVANDSLTARMLMSHTSSILDFNFNNYVTIGDPTTSLGSFLSNYLSPGGSYYNSNNFLALPPGSGYAYSNFGSALNGYLVEPLTGLLFKDYARNNLLLPLEMYRSAWFLNELNINNLAIGYNYYGGSYQPQPHYGMAPYPGVSLRSNVFELANFLIMIMNGGSFKGVQLYDPATIDSMMTLQPNAGNYGLGFQKSFTWNYHNTIQRSTWGHDGGGSHGYAGYIRFCPANNTGVVLLSNSSGWPLFILRRLFDYAAMFVIAEPATEITNTTFVANWQYAPDANNYFLDLSTDETFNSFLFGFENFSVGNQTSFEIAGLDTGTEYYYRIRSVNTHDTSAYSNTVNVLTLLDPNILPGDANCDGLVNVLDVVTIVNYILGSNPEPFCFENADIDGNGSINVLDVTATINIIINGKAAPFPGLKSASAEIFLNQDNITLQSDGTLAGLQFELFGVNPEHLELALPGFEFTSSVKDGKLTGLVYTLENTPLPAGSIRMFNLTARNARLGEVMAANLNAGAVPVIKHHPSPASTHESLLTGIFPNPLTDQVIIRFAIENPCVVTIEVYNSLGQKAATIIETTFPQGMHETTWKPTGIPRGVYLMRIKAGEETQTRKIIKY